MEEALNLSSDRLLDVDECLANGPQNVRNLLGVWHKQSCNCFCGLGHVLCILLETVFLFVQCEQGGSPGTKDGIHHCYGILGDFCTCISI